MAASNSPLKNITREEVSKHNTIESAWMIIDNKIYDLTKFVQEHPCGMAVLTQYAGKDCTKEFRFMDGGHSPSAYAQKEFYLIGEVNEEEKLVYKFDEDKESQEIHNKYPNKDSQSIPSTQTMTECPFVKQNGQTEKFEECDHAK